MATTNESFSSGGQTVPLEAFLPASSGKHPAVFILYGSSGPLPPYQADIVSFAEALVAAGIAATMPHYLESTKTNPSKDDVLKLILEKRPTWRQACSDALTLMANDARFDSTRLGILGFSLGGNLALSLNGATGWHEPEMRRRLLWPQPIAREPLVETATCSNFSWN